MLFRNAEEGDTDEPFPQTITCHLVLPVPHGVGAKVSLPGSERASGKGGVYVDSTLLWTEGVRGCRTERTTGARAPAGDGSAEGVDIGSGRNPEGTYGDPDIQAIPAPEEEALLGQSLLGAGILCGHRWAERRDDSEIREVPREEGTSRGAIQAEVLNQLVVRNAARACILWVQALSHSLSGQSKATSSGRGFLP